MIISVLIHAIVHIEITICDVILTKIFTAMIILYQLHTTIFNDLFSIYYQFPKYHKILLKCMEEMNSLIQSNHNLL